MADFIRTEILVILDASCSMLNEAQEAASGLNDFLAEQAKQPGECLVTLVQFNSSNPYRVIFNRVPAEDAPKIGRDNYVCTGMTPMRECICRGIDRLGAAISQIAEHDRPDKVIVVIITDGMENASGIEFTAAEVNRRVTHQEEVYSWQFIFLGKNICSAKEGAKLGVKGDTTADFNSIRTACAVASSKLSVFRSATGVPADLCFDHTDRKLLAEKPSNTHLRSARSA